MECLHPVIPADRQGIEHPEPSDDVRLGKEGAESCALSARADLGQSAAESVQVAGELERLGQPRAAGTRDTSFHGQPVELRADRIRRPQLGDRPATISRCAPVAAGYLLIPIVRPLIRERWKIK
jgi:hypothetical protein